MEDINHFLATYTIEIIVLMVAVMALYFIVILKQNKDHPKDLFIHEEKIEQKADQKKRIEKEIPSPATIKPIQELQTPNKIIEKRREVPSHGAITKESFTIFKGSKLLIAEDNIINQKVINGMLGDSGIEIIMANNGQEALEILKADKDIYIVLMDAHMPIIDGFEATRHIREDRSLDHLLVVALSGDTAADDIKKMKNAGMQECLEKPLKIDKLYDIFYAYIDIVNGVKLNSSDFKTSNLLHVKEGIEICGGDIELYKEILFEFLNMYADAHVKIKSFIAKDDLNSVKKLLLDISGISANIGAPKLAEISTQLRETLNNDEKNSFIEKEERFTQIFLALCAEIKSYL